jgi:hypothetical protein
MKAKTLLILLALGTQFLISCEEDPPTPSMKNKLVIEGVEYPIEYFLVDELNDDRMIELKSFLNEDQTEYVSFYLEMDFDGSREIPAGIYTFVGSTGVKRAGVKRADHTWLALYNPDLSVDIITNISFTISGNDGGDIKVKGYLNYDDNGNKKIEVDYEGPYLY